MPGTFSRASAIDAAGMVLSHPTRITRPSKPFPRVTSSIESVITSRLTSDARMPSVPIVIPSEIETVLNTRAGVKQAVVVPIMKEGKPESLAAYWVPEAAHKTESETLATELRKQLPESMVPKHFVEMDVLPLSPNGKIDRKILPTIDPKKGDRARVAGGVMEYFGRAEAAEGEAVAAVESDGAPSAAGGYSIVEADSLQDAIAKTKGCPVLDTGGAVEVFEAIAM